MSNEQPKPPKAPRKSRSRKKTPAKAKVPENGSGTPQAAPEGPQPVVLGHIDPKTNQQVNNMRNQSGQMLAEIGRLECRKSQLIHQINQMEAQTQALLKTEAQRLGISEGAPWQLTPDGVALGPPEA